MCTYILYKGSCVDCWIVREFRLGCMDTGGSQTGISRVRQEKFTWPILQLCAAGRHGVGTIQCDAALRLAIGWYLQWKDSREEFLNARKC